MIGGIGFGDAKLVAATNKNTKSGNRFFIKAIVG
jgi:hypothetical protein